MRISFILGVIASVALGDAAQAGTVSFLDTGDGANYNVAFQFKSDPSVSSTLGICPSCGNPGRAIDFEVTVGQSQATSYYGGFLNQAETYNPLVQGAITSISTSMDKDFTISTTEGFNNRARLLLKQDNNFYVATINGVPVQGPGTTGFLNFSASGLLATDFQQVDPATGIVTAASNPNFAGDPVVFGVAQLFGSNGTPNTQLSAIFDNISVTLATASVPEPGTLGLLAAGMTGLTFLRRRHPR